MTNEFPAPPPKKPAHLLLWVPTLYLAMGLPNVTVGAVAAIMYKNMGVSTETIAIYTSQLYLPWVLKPLWSPFLEPFRTKGFWVIAMQFVMMASLGLVAFSLPIPGFFAMSLAFFWITGFASATQDIVADGVFMTTASLKDQARYSGLQGMCWNMGAVIASGVLVSLTGKMHDDWGLSWQHCWMIIMGMVALIMGGFGIWHLRVLPPGEISPIQGHGMASAFRSLKESWVSFFQKPQIWFMIVVVFFYRFGEGFIEKIGPIFLLDAREAGGLGLSNQIQGMINGSVGTVAFIVGAFLGGFLASKMTLRRSFFILALSLNIPHLTYYYLSHAMPTEHAWIAGIVVIEKFGFGMGSVGHMLYMMQQIAPGAFRMTHYAFATGIMAMTKWLTGWISGPIFAHFEHSYAKFFTFVLIASIPPVILAFVAPFPKRYDDSAQTPAAGH
ncbi:MAG: MFS transporter [Verrucomicrobia bacterium]|nr:MFS transporter [Verrucomicrobiota bacterium]